MFVRRPNDKPLVFPLGGESQVADFRITAIADEWLTTVPIVQGEVDPEAPEPESVVVWRMREARNPREGHVEDGIGYSWAGVNERTAIRLSDGKTENQVLNKRYLVGQEITAQTRIIGTPEDVVWVESNSSRAWAQVVEEEPEP